MARPKRLVTAALTFTAALGIGFAMQYGDALAAIFIGEDVEETALTPEAAESVANLGEQASSVTGLPTQPAPEIVAIIGDADAAMPAQSDIEPIILAAVEDDLIVTPVTDAPEVSSVPDCGVAMSAAASAHAMVDIDIDAPCFANESFVMHHQGMMFSATTDDNGAFNAQIPALSVDAFFIAAFDNGEGAIAQATVPELTNYDRAVLQWQGEEGIHLHAREFGASFGEAGHVTLELQAMGDMDEMDAGKGGYMQSFGTTDVPNALIAEVYSFPTALADPNGDIALSAEIEITATNCDREFTAQSLQIIPGDENRANDLMMRMPACDAIGEFLVLKNMFEDLTLASR